MRSQGYRAQVPGAPPLPHPVPHRVETKSQAPREAMLPLFMIGMVESALDIAEEALQSNAIVSRIPVRSKYAKLL
jgi:hypothetical protein